MSLHNKIKDDFHGNIPILREEYVGTLPVLTPKAQIFVATMLPENSFFRIAVDGGGCSGFQYAFSHDTEVQEEDVMINEVPLTYIDKESLNYMWGSIIEFIDKDMQKRLSVIHNPRAVQSCGCHSSFSVKDL